MPIRPSRFKSSMENETVLTGAVAVARDEDGAVEALEVGEGCEIGCRLLATCEGFKVEDEPGLGAGLDVVGRTGMSSMLYRAACS